MIEGVNWKFVPLITPIVVDESVQYTRPTRGRGHRQSLRLAIDYDGGAVLWPYKSRGISIISKVRTHDTGMDAIWIIICGDGKRKRRLTDRCGIWCRIYFAWVGWDRF